MTKYHIIQPSGDTVSGEWTGKLEYACPPFKDIREAIGLAPDETIEHVNVLWKNKRAHMFVDEIGRLRDKPSNAKATRIYWNATLSRNKEGKKAIYSDLAQDTCLFDSRIIEKLALSDSFIVGPVFLWEGDIE